MITRVLARYIVNSRLDDMPAAVRHEGTRAFVNWLGCVLGGSHEEVVARALDAYGEFSGPQQATVIGLGRRLDAPTAALLNTMANFAHGYNETHVATVAHPMGAPGSAAFAQAERQIVSGPDFVHAFILGVETACRIANMIAAAPARAPIGLSVHGVTDVFGAAVATGKLIGLNEDQMVWALGLASMQASGLRSAYGTMGTKLIAGHAARCGMMAAYLAAKGFTCSETSIEDPKGFAAVFSHPSNLPAATDGLGKRYEIMQVAYKPYPCGVVIFAAIDACLALAAQSGFDATEIAQVELRVHPMTLQLCDRPQPNNHIQALTSVQHWVAAALLHRAAGLRQGTDECVRAAEMVALRERIKVTGDTAISATAAQASVTLKSGRQLAASVTQCQGSVDRPMDDSSLDDKFMNQATLTMPAARARELLARCWQLPTTVNVGALAREFFHA